MTHYKGIHHITSIAGDPQGNYDFYVKTLGMRLSLKSVNQDDPGTYHFFFTNANGEPGSSLTFFPWKNIINAQHGSGEASSVSFAVAPGSLESWKDHFRENEVSFDEPFEQFGRNVLPFKDHDGSFLRLVEDTSLNASSTAIQGFWGTTLLLASGIQTEKILTTLLGFEKVASEGRKTLYQTNAPIGHSVIIEKPEMPFPGRMGKGSIHHVAFRMESEEEQLQIRQKLMEMGFQPTEVIDRHVFKSVYFRTPDGVLFELATDGPGYHSVTGDQDPARVLFLPPWLEEHRENIEAALPGIDI